MSTDIIQINDQVRARIEIDHDATPPTEWDNVGEIAFTSSRYTLGTKHVSREEMDEIKRGIEKGVLIGLPVYAYVHGGSMISCGRRTKGGIIVYGNPFSCPWDSGQSGFVYCTKEKAVKEFGNKILTARIRTNVLRCLANEVEAFSQYLEGDVYGVIVERLEGVTEDSDGHWVEMEAVWGMYGIEYAREEANRMGEWEAKQQGIVA